MLAAAAQGGALAFASEASFGTAAGAAPLSQYVASRGGGGWSTANVTPPLLSGTYSAASGDADPYLAFSADLSRAVVSGGWACRGAAPCAEENTPLGPGGPAGYRNLYLREGSTYTPLITEANFPALPAGPSEFHIAFTEASPDLRCVVFSTESGSYEWREGTIAPLAAGCSGAGFTPPGALAVLGASSDGEYVFYLATEGIFRWHAGAGTKVVADADLAHLPPATGPAAVAAGGARLFFTAADPLLPTRDSNGQPDAYEWEAPGAGDCSESSPGYLSQDHGCLGLLSGGRSGSATFAAASASGEDAYFLTAASLLPADPSALDVYDARAGGGFPEPTPGIECEGDECQGPPFVPEDPAPATSVVSGPPNPPVRFPKTGCPKGKHRVVRHGRKVCVAKRHRKHHKRGKR